MGQVLNLGCKCGYKKSVNVGEGLLAIDIELIRFKFTPDELVGFENAVANGTVDYSFGQRIAYCGKCSDVIDTTVLRYVENDTEKLVVKPCEQCESIVQLRNEPGDCPRCGEKLKCSQDNENLWD